MIFSLAARSYKYCGHRMSGNAEEAKLLMDNSVAIYKFDKYYTVT